MRATRTARRARRSCRGLPCIGFVGIHAGRKLDRPISQNETVAALFEREGYQVARASSLRNRALRTLHHAGAILSWRRVDVLVVAVFSGRSFLLADLATRLGRLTGKRLVLFLHGGSLPEFGPNHRRWAEHVLSRADLVLAPSDFLARTFRAWGIDVRVIPNVLDLNQYEYRQRHDIEPRLLWMRTFHEHYDPLMAVRVLHRVAEVHPGASMTMAGADQGLLEATRAEADRLGVTDRIEFPGYIDPEAKRRAFAVHDVFLNTNVVDNMPVSLLEASVSGLIPVVTAVGGIPDIIRNDRNGVLVDAGDDAGMAAAVLGLIADPERCGVLSAGAHALAEASSWPGVYRRWVEELSLVLPEFDFA